MRMINFIYIPEILWIMINAKFKIEENILYICEMIQEGNI